MLVDSCRPGGFRFLRSFLGRGELKMLYDVLDLANSVGLLVLSRSDRHVLACVVQG